MNRPMCALSVTRQPYKLQPYLIDSEYESKYDNAVK